MRADLRLAKETLIVQGLALAVVKDGLVLATGRQEGLVDLLALVDTLTGELRGASLADKVVGKAAAMVACHAGVVAVYSPLMGRAALDTLRERGIEVEYARLVPAISNKAGTGLCLLECLVLPLTDPAEAVAALREFVGQRP